MKTLLSRISILALSAGLLLTGCGKEEGCTDPNATNYDSAAEEDCCCQYESTTDNVVVNGSISSDTEWTNDNIYELDGKVVVESGATLTIQEGTIIKGQEGDNSLASALIIARGGKLMAEGTASRPIVMTTVLDDIEIGQMTGTNLTANDRGKWGGLILLGSAPISAEEGDDEAQIEGIPASETFGTFGGNDVMDNSGVIRYVSVRHGGIALQPGDEINGITCGGVGAGTVLDHIEVVGNDDDGVEFFGGTVDASNVLIAFQADDGIDIDMNYDGTIDNFLVIQDANADAAMEIDGPENTLTDGLFTLRNGMVMTDSPESNIAANLKSKAQGIIEDVTFLGFDSYIRLRASFEDDCTTATTDAFTNYVGGSDALILTNLEFEGTSGLLEVYTGSTNSADEDCELPMGTQAAADTEFSNGGHLIGATSPTIGADLSEFDGWSWASANNKY